MRRKILYIVFICMFCLLLSSCFSKTSYDDAKVTTTLYPIEYLVDRIYGNNSTIVSIYPNDSEINNYKLTDKQLKKYAKDTDLFIYFGLKEKELAKDFIEENNDIQIVDATYGLNDIDGKEQLWLSPNNYLMLADTVKNDLKNIIDNKYINEQIDSNYIKLQEDLSLLDAELRSVGKIAKENNNNTFAIASKSFSFLNEYNYNIIDVSEETYVTSNIKNKFKDGSYKYILVSDEENIPDYIKDLIDNYGTSVITINVMNTLTDEERKDNDNYLTIMKDFIRELSSLNVQAE